MPDHAKQVGVLCQRVIDLLGLSMTEGQSILLGESNIAHMVSRHPADFALYGEYIPLILAAPDYVALNAKDGSIEYVKEVQVNSVYVKVAVRVSARGQRFNIRRSGASLGRLQRTMLGRSGRRPCCCG